MSAASASSAPVVPSEATSGRDRQILDALPISVYAVDLDGRITFVNRASARFAGGNDASNLGDESAVVGALIWDAMPDVAPRARMEEAMALLRTGHAPAMMWESPRSSSDEEQIAIVQISPVVDGHAVTGFVFSTVDVTASVRARDALIETGAALAQPIVVERVLQELSQQLRRATGCEAVAVALASGDLDSLRLAHQVGFDSGAEQLESALRGTWQRVLEQDDGRTVEGSAHLSTRETPQGTEITVSMISGSVRGAVTALVGGLDSPYRRAETERLVVSVAAQAAAAIERAQLVGRLAQRRRLEAISEVTAGVAHELRNPLFGISSAAQLLRFRVRDDPVIEKNVGRILREVERLNGMVSSLLEYGRPAPMRPAPGDPDEVWHDVIEMQRGLLESKALVLRHHVAKPRATCRIDVEQLAQLFTNVLVNAVDAAPEGSDLTVTSAVLPNGAWRSRLHNGGAPIPPQVLPRVFDLFFSTKPGGAGIGLALCQRIAEEHGGTIALESNAEHGTTVSIVLPALRDETSARRET